MAHLSDVLRNLAGLLAQQGVGTYNEGTFASGVGPAIVLKKMPQSIDRCIVLNIVVQGSTRDMDTNEVYLDVMVQTRCRGRAGDSLDPDEMADSVADVLSGLTQFVAGTYTVQNLQRRTHIQNGVDDSDRFEVLSQFYGTVSSH